MGHVRGLETPLIGMLAPGDIGAPELKKSTLDMLLLHACNFLSLLTHCSVKVALCPMQDMVLECHRGFRMAVVMEAYHTFI